MNRKISSIILTIFLLVQSISICELSAGTGLLSPPTKVSLNESQVCIKPLCETICLALLIYKLDAREGYSKEIIRREYGEFINRSSEVHFDLNNIDMGRKVFRKGGWTRYYPFSVGPRQFIIRIFLYEERYCQPWVPAIYEDRTSGGELVFQILPGINELLKDCRIKPNNLSLESPVNTSP